jgi:hypothetical protein
MPKLSLEVALKEGSTGLFKKNPKFKYSNLQC